MVGPLDNVRINRMQAWFKQNAIGVLGIVFVGIGAYTAAMVEISTSRVSFNAKIDAISKDVATFRQEQIEGQKYIPEFIQLQGEVVNLRGDVQDSTGVMQDLEKTLHNLNITLAGKNESDTNIKKQLDTVIKTQETIRKDIQTLKVQSAKKGE